MADKATNRKKLTLGQWHFWGAAVAIGIALLILVFISSTNAEMDSTRYALSDTVNYIKKQCATYSSLNLASETKSLMRVMESVQQINRDICDAEAIDPNVVIDDKLLAEYTRQHYLTGILLMDPTGEIEAQYCNSDEDFTDFQEEFRKDPIWDVVTRPEKTYSARISCADGSYIDMAAYGRKDKPGIIVAYYHTPLEYVGKRSARMKQYGWNLCADTGIGMSPEFQKHLFEPFTQENSEARSTYEGTGL